MLDEQPLVRRVEVSLGEVEAGDDRRNAPVGERRDDRQGPARAEEQRPDAERALERVLAEPDRRRVGRDQPRRRGRPEVDLDVAPRPAPTRAAAARPPARSPPPSGRRRAGSRGSPRRRPGSPSSGAAASRPRRRSRRPRARPRCGRRTPRPRAASIGLAPWSDSTSAPACWDDQSASSCSVGGTTPLRSGSGRRPSGPARTPESVRISACVADSAAPPNEPE